MFVGYFGHTFIRLWGWSWWLQVQMSVITDSYLVWVVSGSSGPL